MNLLLKQQTFSKLIAKLILYANDRGYGVTVGEFLRTPEMAKIYSDQGKGIANSLHTLKLAADLNFFIDYEYISDGDKLLEIGEFWEALSTHDYVCSWGGRFHDGNHFSIVHNGVK